MLNSYLDLKEVKLVPTLARRQKRPIIHLVVLAIGEGGAELSF